MIYDTLSEGVSRLTGRCREVRRQEEADRFEYTYYNAEWVVMYENGESYYCTSKGNTIARGDKFFIPNPDRQNTHHNAFCHGIMPAPVYADWLEENVPDVFPEVLNLLRGW